MAAIIAAAGSSRRMAGQDKIFADLAGRPLLAWTIDAFERCPAIDQIVVALAASNLAKGQALAKESGWRKIIAICAGGARRQDSVLEGLKHIKGCEWVIIHDGARPCLTEDLIQRGLIEAKQTGAAIAAVPVSDTIKVVSPGGTVTGTPARETLWSVQTPQVFRYDVLWKAYQSFNDDVTDDAALVERSGCPVRVYTGSRQNIKVTTPEDLVFAEAILKSRATRQSR